MKSIDRLRQIMAKTSSAPELRFRSVSAPTGKIAGLPELSQIVPPPIVAAYFVKEPAQRQIYLDKVAAVFRQASTQLEARRIEFNRELRELQAKHQAACDEGDERAASDYYRRMDRLSADFETRHARELNLAKGSALVVANQTLESIENNLRRAEYLGKKAEEEKLARLSDAELAREQIRLNREILAELRKR